MQVVLDVIEALEADGIRKIVLQNSHGGNTDTLRATLRTHAHTRKTGQGAFVCIASGPPAPEGLIQHPSDHGGESEVCRLMHIRGDLVREDKLADNPLGRITVESLRNGGAHFVKPWHLHMPESAGGEQRTSTEKKGRALVEGCVEHLARLLVDLTNAPWTETFPFETPG